MGASVAEKKEKMMSNEQWYPLGAGVIQRMGYSGFLSAVIMLWRMNRNAKQLGLVTKAEFTLPVRWLA